MSGRLDAAIAASVSVTEDTVVGFDRAASKRLKDSVNEEQSVSVDRTK